MNPLDQYPAVRKVLYVIQWVANGVLLVLGIAFTTLGVPLEDLPRWYVLVLAIAPALWTYLGLTASANVPAE